MPRRSSGELPLPAWPVEAYEHEPSYGFFIRLAERNSVHSARVLAEHFGLNGRDFDPAELLDFCLQFPARNRERLIGATPKFDGEFVLINDQKFRKRTDWSIRAPRVCDACLAESCHYRNWWDITAIARCPIHNQGLVSERNGVPFAWWVPAIGETSTSSHFSEFPQTSGICLDRESWDAYALGRMGIIRVAADEVLDDTDLFAVIEVAELLGRAAKSGWQRRWPAAPRMHSEERHTNIVRGYQYLRSGEEGVKHFLREYLHGAPTTQAGNQRFGLPEFFGWLFQAIHVAQSSPLKQRVRLAMRKCAAEEGVFNRKSRRYAPGHIGTPVTLNELAKEIGLTPRKTRTIAVKLNLTVEHRDRNKPHLFGPDEVEQMKSTLRSLVCRREAAEWAGMSLKEFNTLVDDGVVKPFIRLHGPEIMSDHFLPAEIKAAMTVSRVAV